MITYHLIRATESHKMYSELLGDFYKIYNRLRPEIEKWTAEEQLMIHNAMRCTEKTIIECGEEAAGLEGDAKSIVFRKHMLRAINMTRLSIRYLNKTEKKYADAAAAEAAATDDAAADDAAADDAAVSDQ